MSSKLTRKIRQALALRPHIAARKAVEIVMRSIRRTMLTGEFAVLLGITISCAALLFACKRQDKPDTNSAEAYLKKTRDSLYEYSVRLIRNRRQTEVCSTLAVRIVRENLGRKLFAYNTDSVKCAIFNNAGTQWAIICYPKREGTRFTGEYCANEIFRIDHHSKLIRIAPLKEPVVYSTGLCITDVNMDNCYDVLLVCPGDFVEGGESVSVNVYDKATRSFQNVASDQLHNCFYFPLLYPKQRLIRGIEMNELYYHVDYLSQTHYYTYRFSNNQALKIDSAFVLSESSIYDKSVYRGDNPANGVYVKRPPQYNECTFSSNLRFIPENWPRIDLRDRNEIR